MNHVTVTMVECLVFDLNKLTYFVDCDGQVVGQGAPLGFHWDVRY